MDKKILLVDDAAFMRMLIRNTLTTNGYTNILEAADGEIAVSTYSAEKPDLVIMDITMPNKTGIEALKEIKAMDPGAKVVMCSAMNCRLVSSRQQPIERLTGRGYQARRSGLHRKAFQG